MAHLKTHLFVKMYLSIGFCNSEPACTHNNNDFFPVGLEHLVLFVERLDPLSSSNSSGSRQFATRSRTLSLTHADISYRNVSHESGQV